MKFLLFLLLHSLYSSPNIVTIIKSRRMRWAGHVARMGEGRGVYRVLVGRPEVKRRLGRPRRRWEDNNSFKSPTVYRPFSLRFLVVFISPRKFL
jgi:hypothetical protein